MYVPQQPYPSATQRQAMGVVTVVISAVLTLDCLAFACLFESQDGGAVP